MQHSVIRTARKPLLQAINRTGRLWSGLGNSQSYKSWSPLAEEGISLFETNKLTETTGLYHNKLWPASRCCCLLCVQKDGYSGSLWCSQWRMCETVNVHVCVCVFVFSEPLNPLCRWSDERRSHICVCESVCGEGWMALYWHDQHVHMSAWVTYYRWCYNLFVIRLALSTKSCQVQQACSCHPS